MMLYTAEEKTHVGQDIYGLAYHGSQIQEPEQREDTTSKLSLTIIDRAS